MKLIKQNNPTTSGQACISMISGKSIEDVIMDMKTERSCKYYEANIKQMMDVLDLYGIGRAPRNIQLPRTQSVPDNCSLLYVRMKTGNSHWVLKFDQKFYDPEFGILEGEYPHGQITSYLEIFPDPAVVGERTTKPVQEAQPAQKPQVAQRPQPAQKPQVAQRPQPAQKPEVAPRPQPAQKPEAAPRPQPVQKPEAAPRPQPAQKPEVAQRPQPVQKPEVAPRPQPTQKAQPAQTAQPTQAVWQVAQPTQPAQTVQQPTQPAQPVQQVQQIAPQKDTYQEYPEDGFMLELRLVDESNEVEVGSLAVRNSQKMFVDNNIMSIAMAKKNPKVLVPLGIYVNGEAVGFAMLAFDENYNIEDNRYWLVRFMIDQNYQGLGYGKEAMNAVIRYFNSHYADRIKLSTSPANTVALNLFHEFGFRETGERNDNEIILKRFL